MYKRQIGQQARWLEILEEYDYTIEHRTGSKHCNADALLRRIDKITGDDPVTTAATGPAAPIVDWPSEQKADSDLCFVYDLVATNADRPSSETIAHRSSELKILCNQLEQLTIIPYGTLCRRFHSPGHQPVLQKLVPVARRQELAAELHKGLYGGHLGNRRAKMQLQQRYYWPGWSAAVRMAKQRCSQCSRHAPRTCHRPAVDDARYDLVC